MTPNNLRSPPNAYLTMPGPKFLDHRMSMEAMNTYIDEVARLPKAARHEGFREIFSALFNFTHDQQLGLIRRMIIRTINMNDDQLTEFSNMLIRQSEALNAEKNIDEVIDYAKQVSEWLLDAVIMRTSECIIDTCIRVSALGQHHPGLLDAFLTEQVMQALDQAPVYETGLVPAAAKMIWNLSPEHSLPYLRGLFDRLPEDTPTPTVERISALEALVEVTEYMVPQPGSPELTARIRETLNQVRIRAGDNPVQ